MSGKVKVKVADHHIRTSINIGDKKATKQEPVKVDEDNPTVQNCLEQGSLEVVDNFHETDEDEVEGEHDGDGETDTGDVEESGEEEEDEQSAETEEESEEEDLEDLSYRELQKKAGDIEDVDATQKKEELLEDLKDELE